MAGLELFSSCRSGDLNRVRFLVENGEAELNLRDCWDSTPLYYACLCGHESLVEFLLQNGARCAPNTFDGERCLYAALTDKIRSLLKGYKAITSECMRRDSYREFLRRSLEEAPFADVCFLVHGESFHVHRVVMVARSEYFAHMFMSKWRDRPIIELKHKLVKPWAFRAILQYLYTDRMYVDLDCIDDCIRLARQCKLEYLKTQLETRLKSIEVFGMSKTRTQSITVVSIEPESQSTDLQDSFGHVAEFSIPAALRTQQFPRPFPFEISLDMLDASKGGEKSNCALCSFLVFFEDPPLYADVCFIVEGIRFYGHKVFFCGRSDYFRALLDGHFSESVSPGKLVLSESVPEVYLNDVTPEVFATVVAFIYQDEAVLTEETVFSVLYLADVYLLNGLKRLCERVLSTLLDEENVLHVLRTARLFDLVRLEADCCEYVAKNLDKIIDEKEFHAIILEDAASVRNRQETDSVPIVDDIRFHLYRGILPNNTTDGEELVDCENKLSSLEDLLISLGLEC